MERDKKDFGKYTQTPNNDIKNKKTTPQKFNTKLDMDSMPKTIPFNAVEQLKMHRNMIIHNLGYDEKLRTHAKGKIEKIETFEIYQKYIRSLTGMFNEVIHILNDHIVEQQNKDFDVDKFSKTVTAIENVKDECIVEIINTDDYILRMKSYYTYEFKKDEDTRKKNIDALVVKRFSALYNEIVIFLNNMKKQCVVVTDENIPKTPITALPPDLADYGI